MVRNTLPSQDASTHQIWNSYLKEYRRYAPDMKRDGRTEGHCDYYKNWVRGQGQDNSDPKMVRGTPPSQDASTNQIWNSYLKEYRRYAPDTKRDGRTVRLLYASQSSFGGIKNPSTVKAPNIAHLSIATSVGYNKKQTWKIVLS